MEGNLTHFYKTIFNKGICYRKIFMNIIAIIFAIFMFLSILDLILGNRLGLGETFQKSFSLFGELAMSMIGLIVLSPVIARLLTPLLTVVCNYIGIDPSLITSSIFAIDMGGAPIATAIAQNQQIGQFNGIVVASMAGCTISFTIPYALRVVKKEHYDDLILGLLCGIITIPVGCLISGFMLRFPFSVLLANIMPVFLFSIILAFFLYRFPIKTIAVFRILGYIIQSFIYVGLAIGIWEQLTGLTVVEGTAPIDEGITIVASAVFILSGALPILLILQKVFNKPLSMLGHKLGINNTSALCLIGTLATSTTTFVKFSEMDKKGRVLNAALAVSAAFALADHLAFAMAFNNAYVLPMVIGKIVSGLTALIVATAFSKILSGKQTALTYKTNMKEY